MDAGDDTVARGGGHDAGIGIDHVWLVLVEALRAAKRQRQVGRPDVKAVEAGRRGDGVERGKPVGGLDHRELQHLVIGVLAIVKAGMDHRSGRA